MTEDPADFHTSLRAQTIPLYHSTPVAGATIDLDFTNPPPAPTEVLSDYLATASINLLQARVATERLRLVIRQGLLARTMKGKQQALVEIAKAFGVRVPEE